MPTESKIPPFREFIASVQAATHAQARAMPESKVASPDSFAAMKAHILKLYEGVEAKHSFVDDNGSIFDCIPVEQQPALRGAKSGVAKAPDLPAPETKAGGPRDERRALEARTAVQKDSKDRHGNAMACPEGTIPMRRVSLEELARFETLQQFFQKSPVGGGPPPTAAPQARAVPATHRWAHAYQSAANLGGHSYLNLWDPAIGANQVFSLSQHWYVAGSGDKLQTAEVGWQVYPQKYGNTKPVFFIYWTADNYKNTGCYNLDCSAFVQINNSWTIGGTISPSSTQGGSQYEIQATFYLYQGRWWLYMGGTSSGNAIGYYPVSIYKNGAMASHAAEIDYGGEVVGTTSWPPMGSGKFANTGWQHAAYQRDIYYFPTAGGAMSASLTGSQSWPQCYTVTVTRFNAPWNETIFYGGPGGTNC
jgi:hypothetical protein